MKNEVICAAVDCKYNNDKNICTAKRVRLNTSSVMTIWNGREEFWKCGTFEKSQEAQELEAAIEKFLKESEDLLP